MRYISFILFLFVALQIYAQTPVKIDNPKREIRYMKFDRFYSSYLLQSVSLPELVIAAIKDGRIKPFKIDLSSYTLTPLTLAQWQSTLEIPAYDQEANYISTGVMHYPRDFTKIGFDQTYGTTSDGKEIAQVHYVHFGVNENSFMQTGFCFSIKWQDFISVLSQTPYLYSTNCYGSWWNGSILLTNESYTNDVGTWFFYMNLYKDGSLVHTTSAPSENCDPDKSFNFEDQFDNAGFLNEKNTNGSFEINSVTLNRERNIDNLGCTFSWKDFQEIALKNSSGKKGEVFTYADAIRLKKLKYDDSFNHTVSANGKFENSGLADPLCKNMLINSFEVTNPVSFSTLHTSHLEELNLKHARNAAFFQKPSTLNSLIAEYVLNQSLKAYYNDSLNKVFTPGEIPIQMIYPAGYYIDQQYRIGDSIEWKGKIYEVTKPMEPTTERSEDEFLSSIKKREITSTDISRLYILQLSSTLRFDTTGMNKRYELTAVSLILPSKENAYQIDRAVWTVRWEDLKKLLLADKRALVIYKGKQVNMVELLEQRIFFTSFLKTGLLRRD